MIYSMALFYIDSKVEESVRTSAFLAKLKYKDSSYNKKVKDLYYSDLDNREKALTFIFYNWFLAKHDETINQYNNEVSFSIMNDIIGAIDRILEQEPLNWLMLIMKYRLLSFSYEAEDTIINGLENLIEEQKKSEYKSYYIVTYIFLSEIYYSMSNRDKAIKIIDDSKDLEGGKIELISDFFRSFLVEYKNKLKISGDSDIVEKVSLIEEIYF